VAEGPRVHARLTRGALALDDLVAGVADEAHGATVTFTGTTRREQGPPAVVRLEYEAYEPMARAEMEAIGLEAARRYGAHVAAAHRLGPVPAGEASVGVAASAAHRPAAFAACRHVIDEIKRRAPIWKQDVHADGTRAWQDGLPPVPVPGT